MDGQAGKHIYLSGALKWQCSKHEPNTTTLQLACFRRLHRADHAAACTGLRCSAVSNAGREADAAPGAQRADEKTDDVQYTAAGLVHVRRRGGNGMHDLRRAA